MSSALLETYGIQMYLPRGGYFWKSFFRFDERLTVLGAKILQINGLFRLLRLLIYVRHPPVVKNANGGR